MSTPFMQLYVADYLGDTRHLTTEQHGAYLLLLMTMWRADGRLPLDDRKLARLTGCTASRWAKIRDEVLAFFVIDGDEITHGRLMFELEKASEKSIKRAEAGSHGGKAKALKDKASAVANATPLPCHSSEPEPDTKEAKASSVVPRLPALRPTAGFDAFWAAYPRKVAKDAARKAFAKAVNRMTEDDPLAVILAGIERALPGWTDPNFIPHPASWLNAGRWEDEAPNVTPLRLTHAKSDKLAARHENYADSWSGAESAVALMASRRALGPQGH